jgi:hypothetical protein
MCSVIIGIELNPCGVHYSMTEQYSAVAVPRMIERNNREHKSSSSSSRDQCIPRRFIAYNSVDESGE